MLVLDRDLDVVSGGVSDDVVYEGSYEVEDLGEGKQRLTMHLVAEGNFEKMFGLVY